MRIVSQQTILIKYHALFAIFEKKNRQKFEIVVCCKLYVALQGLKFNYLLPNIGTKTIAPLSVPNTWLSIQGCELGKITDTDGSLKELRSLEILEHSSSLAMKPFWNRSITQFSISCLDASWGWCRNSLCSETWGKSK